MKERELICISFESAGNPDTLVEEGRMSATVITRASYHVASNSEYCSLAGFDKAARGWTTATLRRT
jgi:hypothetical protein